MNDDFKSHPSYGMVGFTRIHGRTSKLFGSVLEQHMTSILLRISRGVVYDPDSHRHYLGREELIEVELSSAQFAELLTTMNMGSGVPCTIRHINGAGVEGPPEEELTEVERSQEIFNAKAQKVAQGLRQGRKTAADILAKKSLTKDDKKLLLDILETAEREVGANMPFLHECFQETTDKMVSSAKAEVDAFTTHTILVAGLKAIQGDQVALLPPHSDDSESET